MNSKEKAKELVEHYAETIDPIVFGVLQERNWKLAKKCALIAVDEIIIALAEDINPLVNYWYEVKQEIFQL